MVKKFITLLGLLVISSVIVAFTTLAVADPSIIDLLPSGAQAGDHFGFSVSVSNNLAVVGSPYATRIPNCGMASIFQYNPQKSIWMPLSTLIDYDTNSCDFGRTTLIDGISIPPRALIGSPSQPVLSQSGVGVAYLYQQQLSNISQWDNITQFIPPDPQANANFGSAIALSPTCAVIGAPNQDVSVPTAGTAYIFYGNANNWSFLKRVNASNPNTGDQFGISVAIDNDLILVGASLGNNASSVDIGTAYLFQKDHNGPDQWGQIVFFASPYSTLSDYFGYSVSLSGDIIIIGSYGAQINRGIAHTFYRNQGSPNNWGLSKSISQVGSNHGFHFGYSVAIKGLTVAIGAYGTAGGIGASYIVQLTNTGNTTTLPLYSISDPLPNSTSDSFGSSVAIDTHLALFGSPGKNSTGKAYSILLLPFDNNNNNNNNNVQCSTLCRLLIILGIATAVGVGLIIGIGIILKNRKSPDSKTEDRVEDNADMTTMGGSRKKSDVDMMSNYTQNTNMSAVSEYSKVRQISLNDMSSIKLEDLDFNNPKVTKRL